MYLTIEESRELAAKVTKWWKKLPCDQAELILCPSTLALSDVSRQIDGSTIKLGIQEMSLSHQLGAFTGQNAGEQIKEAGIEYVLMGHSEMRQFYGVTDQMVASQMHAALAHKLHPVICIGETKAEREKGQTDHTIVRQLHTIFAQSLEEPAPITIAYEPRWAIGTGQPVEPAEAERVHDLIRHTVMEFFSEEDNQIQILYGGSVNADNILDFLNQPNVDGALIGSASAKLEPLRDIIDTIQTNLCT